MPINFPASILIIPYTIVTFCFSTKVLVTFVNMFRHLSKQFGCNFLLRLFFNDTSGHQRVLFLVNMMIFILGGRLVVVVLLLMWSLFHGSCWLNGKKVGLFLVDSPSKIRSRRSVHSLVENLVAIVSQQQRIGILCEDSAPVFVFRNFDSILTNHSCYKIVVFVIVAGITVVLL